jgi:oxygen-dependent protoporphyrinogen oxidase
VDFDGTIVIGGGVAVVQLGFRTEDLAHPPRGFGILVPSREGTPPLGMIAASNVFPNHTPEGHTLATAMMGGARAPAILDQTDEAITEQYTPGHAKRLAAIDERLRSLSGLALKGNSYRGVSVGAAVEDALTNA